MYTRAVVPLDGSAVSEAIVPFILKIAVPLDLEVNLLRVVPRRTPPPHERGSYPAQDDEATLTARAMADLAPLVARLRAQHVRTRTAVRLGDPVDEILAGAAEAGADLIAMTTHGRSGLGRLLFGSVAEAVLRRATIPVLLLRQAESGASPASPIRSRL